MMMRKCLISVVITLGLPCSSMADESNSKELARLRTELGAAYFSRGQYAVALEELQNALKSDSKYLPAYSVRGLVYAELKEFDQAEADFQKALSIDGNHADANHNYAWFLCNRRNRPLDAIKYFTAALRDSLYATPEKSLQHAGLCALKAGDAAQAESFLQKADLQQPDNPTTLLGLAELAYLRGEYESARKLLSRHARLGSTTAESLWLNIKVERRLNQRDSEAGFAKELQSRFPSSKESALLAQGRYD